MQRELFLQRIIGRTEPWDLAVVGGGATGVGIAVDATSGTFLLADENNRPLTLGVMYNDLRAAAEAADLPDHLAVAALRQIWEEHGSVCRL